MIKKRIERKTSRTAAWTCVSRAASALEKNDYYHSEDRLALRLLPGLARLLIHLPWTRKFFVRRVAPPGIYEYVIARTKYIDAAFRAALAERFDQILILGAGFDTRALRFRDDARDTPVFELDAPLTQKAKIRQYRKRNLSIPSNVVFIAMDFDREPLPAKLDQAGFKKERCSLFILEGVLMYLDPASVRATFKTIQQVAGEGSRVVFDYVRSSVIRREDAGFGQGRLLQAVAKAGEEWRFGLDPEAIESFAAGYGLMVHDHQCAPELEATYFQDKDGRPVGRVNGTHCLVTAVKPYSDLVFNSPPAMPP